MPVVGRAEPVRTNRGRPAATVSDGRNFDPGRRPGCRAALIHATALLCLSLLVACGSLGSTRADLKPWPEIRPDFRVEALRSRIHEYAITFAAEVDLVSAAIV